MARKVRTNSSPSSSRTGAQALKFARCRKGTCGNDFGRAARQQEVLQKLRQKIFTPGVYLNPVDDQALVTAVSNHTQSDLTIDNLIEVGWAMEHAKSTTKFVFSTSPGGFLVDAVGSSDLLPATGNFNAMAHFVQNIFQ